MRNLPGILLLLCLWAPFVGTYSWLKYEKKQVKREIKKKIIAGLDKSDLALVKVSTLTSKTALHWKHAHEFEYQGQMYDVVEIQHVGDSTYYWCWWDAEETHLNRQLNQLVANALGNNPQHKETQNRLIRFVQHLYCSPPPQWQLKSPPEDLCGRKAFWANTLPLISFTSSPPTPPPEFYLI
ncbi:MAG: hypothetical protein IPN33_03045 [Saprospiraceae bacterium]|nr:hypothetical protein [Saprospiraceae bacterium]